MHKKVQNTQTLINTIKAKVREIQDMINLTVDKELLPLRRLLFGENYPCEMVDIVGIEEYLQAEEKLCYYFAEQLYLLSELDQSELEWLARSTNGFPRTQQWLVLITGLDEDVAIGLLKIHEVTLWDLLSQDPSVTRMQLAKFGTQANHVAATLRCLDQLNDAYHHLLIERGEEVPSSPILLSSSVQPQSHHYVTQDHYIVSSSVPFHGRISSSSLPEEPASSANSLEAFTAAANSLHQRKSSETNHFARNRSSTSVPRQATPMSPQVCGAVVTTTTTASTTSNHRSSSRQKSPCTPPPKSKLKLAPDVCSLHKSVSQDSNLVHSVTSVVSAVDERVVLNTVGATAVSTVNCISSPSAVPYAGSLSSPLSVSLASEPKPRLDGKQYTAEKVSYLVSERQLSRDELISPSAVAPLDSSSSSSSSPLQPPNLQPHHLNVQLPRSPGGATMAHSIQHKFKDELFPAPGSKCEFCAKALISGKTFSMKCKSCLHCRKKFHKSCALKAAPACSLPPAYLDYYLKSLHLAPSAAGDQSRTGTAATAASPKNAKGLHARKVSQISLPARLDAIHGHGTGSPQSVRKPSYAGHPGAFRNMNSTTPAFPDSSSDNSLSNPSSTPSSPFISGIVQQSMAPYSATSCLSLVNAGAGGGAGSPHPDMHRLNHISINVFRFDQDALTEGAGGGLERSAWTNSNSSTVIDSSGGLLNLNDGTKYLDGTLASNADVELHSLTDNRKDSGLGQHSVRSTDSTADVVNTNSSNESDRTVTDSGDACIPRLDSVDSVDGSCANTSHGIFHRNHSISLHLKEWDIPFKELVLEQEIGRGRFGTVYKGQWHGKVAIKLMDMDEEQVGDQLTAFKVEVSSNLRKTRHENLILFMGVCLQPPQLCIVTSFCEGKTLYTHLHERKDRFPVNKCIILAAQIAQGMGYLHARGILHKDLKSRNIFVDGMKALIGDFGLFNVTRLCGRWRRLHCKPHSLAIPCDWLCYLAPEVIQRLHPDLSHTVSKGKQLPFSRASDVYAFGTVWFELLTGDFPYKECPAEMLIWQVGRGLRHPLNTVPGPRDFKEITLVCWRYEANERPGFQELVKSLDRLPKLHRSPSQPVNMSRSHESLI